MNSVVPLKSPGAAADAAASDTQLEALLQQYRALLRRTILRVCPPESGLSCDDIEQEAWISILQVLRGEREIKYPVSYIYKVAVSATLRAIRRAKARREESLDEEHEDGGAMVDLLAAPSEASPHALAERQECKRKIAEGLARLPENRRLAVMNHLQGLTTREIGGLLGWSEPKARNLVHRGLKDLRTALRALGIEYGP